MLDERTDGEVDGARFKGADGLGRRKMLDREHNIGGALLKPAQEFRKEEDFVHVAHAHGERVGGSKRVESRALGEQAVHLTDGLAHRIDQLQRFGRGFEAGRRARQQRIVELLPKFRERMAHGRLTEADRHGSAAHVALGDQRVECKEQTEVHRA